jgi:hypothetical protein
MSNTQTTVAEADIDINTLLAQPGADVALLPDGTKKPEKPSIFSNKKMDMTFLDNPDPDEGEGDEADPEKKKAAEAAKAAAANPTPASTQAGADLLDNLGKKEGEEDEGGTPDPNKKGGRATGIVELTTKLIEEGLLTAFEGDTPIDKYTLKDFEDLYKENNKAKEEKMQKDLSTAFFDNLPEELQFAASYVANGGQDLKGLFKKLADVREVYEVDGKSEASQEMVIRNYLTATQFGTADEIQEQLNEWKDQDLLEKKFNNFQPKLTALKEQERDRILKQQEGAMRQYQAQTKAYTEDVYKVLDSDNINGIKLDKKSQSMLYAGLINPAYTSRQGAKTNMLGHLLEKYQWIEPDHGRIAEALWLLADPEGYKAKVRETTKKEVTADTVRKLKTEEANKNTSSGNGVDENEQRGTGKKTTGLARPAGFFKR